MGPRTPGCRSTARSAGGRSATIRRSRRSWRVGSCTPAGARVDANGGAGDGRRSGRCGSCTPAGARLNANGRPGDVRDAVRFFSLLDERLRLGGEGYSPSGLAKIEYAGGNEPSFERASGALAVLAEFSISAKHVQRITERLGAERAAQRDAGGAGPAGGGGGLRGGEDPHVAGGRTADGGAGGRLATNGGGHPGTNRALRLDGGHGGHAAGVLPGRQAGHPRRRGQLDRAAGRTALSRVGAGTGLPAPVRPSVCGGHGGLSKPGPAGLG